MRRRPDPDQSLFPWVWRGDDDEPDDSDDDLDAEPEPDPPPLRERVRHRTDRKTAVLWGITVRVSRAPTRPSVAETTGTQSGNAQR